MSLLVQGATVIDGTGNSPVGIRDILIEDGRIKSVSTLSREEIPAGTTIVKAEGKYATPGLMNANVHLFGLAARLQTLIKHEGNYEAIIIESAQIALKNGLTTVFDTYGPRRHLMAVRDMIAAGSVVGSRFYCAGNIIGFDGPFSADFHPKAAEVVSQSFANRINSIWVENSGRHLMWLTPDAVAAEVQAYIERGIDFVKYGSSEHCNASAGAFLAFSNHQQSAIVEQAHASGVTAQAHSMSVEALRLAVEAGCDLVTHCNITGPVPIPESTIDEMARRQTGAVIFPWTEKALAWIRDNVSDLEWMIWQSTDVNARNLIKSGAPLLLANDGVVLDSETRTDPRYAKSWSNAPDGESLINLADGHFFWMRAMEEKGCQPIELLKAATINIAIAYGKQADLGTLEAGKFADILLLDRNPLESAENYRSIAMVIKEGAIIDRDALPEHPIATVPTPPPAAEEGSYIPAVPAGPRLPICPMCACH